MAARAYARACLRAERPAQELTAVLSSDLMAFLIGREPRQQAAVAALLELGRADLVAKQREDGRPFELSTYANSRHNWEFIAAVVDHWEALAAAVPDIWPRFRHSPVIVTELSVAREHLPSSAGEGNHANVCNSDAEL